LADWLFVKVDMVVFGNAKVIEEIVTTHEGYKDYQPLPCQVSRAMA